MIERFKNLSVTNKIAIVVPIGLAVISGLFGLISETFRNLLAKGWDLLQTNYLLPLWGIIVLYIAGIATSKLFYSIKNRHFEHSDKVTCGGLIWQFDDSQTGFNLLPLCPNCFGELDVGNSDQKIFICISCEKTITTDIPYSALRSKAEAEYKRVERRNDYKNNDERIKETRKKASRISLSELQAKQKNRRIK